MHNFSLIIQIAYLAAALLFIFGLKRMSSPKTAASGLYWAGAGMLVAILATFLFPGLHNIWLIIIAIAISSIIAVVTGRVVKMTAMPEMIAMFNGMGGGAAATIAAIELMRLIGHHSSHMPMTVIVLGLFGAMIGSISFTGSILAFVKLRDWIKNATNFPMQQIFNGVMFLLTVAFGIAFIVTHSLLIFILFFVFSLIYGVLMTIPIGGADMPVVIALYNAFTGLAVACEGFLLNNIAMIVAGTVVGAAGSLLTVLMAKAMNRSICNILFSKFTVTGGAKAEGVAKSLDATDAALTLSYVNSVVIVPGYGMAAAQAQQKVWELTQILIDKGVDVKFAIHPVAGRMPGHMNVLLAEAGVPYDYIYDLEDINGEFPNTDVAIVLGANDVVNPAARTDKTSPIYGMPILDVDYAHQTFVIKRSMGAGYSGVQNHLFFAENTSMVFGDAKSVLTTMIQTLKNS